MSTNIMLLVPLMVKHDDNIVMPRETINKWSESLMQVTDADTIDTIIEDDYFPADLSSDNKRYICETLDNFRTNFKEYQGDDSTVHEVFTTLSDLAKKLVSLNTNLNAIRDKINFEKASYVTDTTMDGSFGIIEINTDRDTINSYIKKQKLTNPDFETATPLASGAPIYVISDDIPIIFS